jgi:hypothetical protein
MRAVTAAVYDKDTAQGTGDYDAKKEKSDGML